ncbi:MAG: DUF4129 domain-containing protein [Anaerolineae bacterium]|jgi:hypothetical protein
MAASLMAGGRREATLVALAAAELCWLAPALLALQRLITPHAPALLWLALLILLLGFFYLCRAVTAAELDLRFQQGLLVAFLLLAIGLFLRYHVYTGPEGRGIGWLAALYRSVVTVDSARPGGWLAVMLLVYLWARGIHLAHRSLSPESVGFSFRAGVLLLIGTTLFATIAAGQDVGGFILFYFFFSLVAVALARTDQIQELPNSSGVGYSGFWIGSTLGAVAILVLLGVVVAAFFSGGGLAQILGWLSPVLTALGVLLAAIAIFFLWLIDRLLSLLSIDLGALEQSVRETLQRLSDALVVPVPPPLPGAEADARPILSALQIAIAVGFPLLVVSLVLLFTWYRRRRAGVREADESRESLLSARAVGENLRSMLRDGLDRLGELAGLVNRFGLGARFLAAVSIRRIYANVVRLASDAGYPRARSQTPYEYLPTLYRALPGSEADVQLITEAYVNAHYGQVPDSREELQRIRTCWEQIRARGAVKES